MWDTGTLHPILSPGENVGGFEKRGEKLEVTRERLESLEVTSKAS